VSIEDFGKDCSILLYLIWLPIYTTISMIHSLDLSVIAKSVETKEQLNFLKTPHSNVIQAYYFCRQVPEAKFEIML